MAQVKRFFHVRDKTQPRGGATVLVTGDDGGGPVRVQIAYCSPNDQFARALGRQKAEEARPIAFPLKGLPGLLHKVSKKVLRRTKYHGQVLRRTKYHGQWTGVDIPKNWRQKHELFQRDWSFSTKYWMPRLAKADNPEVGYEAANHIVANVGLPH